MNYTKQTDWFDIHIDNATKVITVKQRWAYKWAHHLGDKVWTRAEEKLFQPYPILLIHLFWRAIPRLKVKGNSTFARENSQGSFQLRFELEHSPTHPLLGTPHCSIHIYKHRNRLCTSSSVFWHSRQVILNLHEVLGEETSRLKGFNSSAGTTLSNSAVNGLKNTESHSGTLSSHFDREHITNSGLTLRDLNVKHVLRELNKVLPHTTFYSDFSTDFDYHATLNQGSGASTVQAKDTTKRVMAPFRFAAERNVRPPEPESKESTPQTTPLVLNELQPATTEKNKINTDPNTVYDINGRKLTNGHNAGKTIEVNGYKIKVDGNGFPDFTSHPPIALDKDGKKMMIEIDNMRGDHVKDYKEANKLAGFGEGKYDHETFDNGKYKDYVWHHHQDGKTMILVHKDAHDTRRKGYNHAGGAQVCKHNKNYPDNCLYFPSPKKD